MQPPRPDKIVKIGTQAATALESSLIRQLRMKDNVSRVELARRMALAPSTVGHYVDRLIGEGFVREGRKTVQPAGRPPTVLELNPRAGQFIGIDFEAQSIWATRVDFAQQPQDQRRVPLLAKDTAADVLDRIAGVIESLMPRRGRLLGIGVGVPGAVDQQHGIGLHYEFIPDWRDVAIRAELHQRFRVPVHLENNIRAMALAEQLFGQGRGVDNFLCLGIRAGIAAGLVINGQLHCGPRNLAGEIGGWPCESDETLEQMASLTAIGRQLAGSMAAKKGTTAPCALSAEQVLNAARERDVHALQALREAAARIGRVIAQLNLVLNPELVILAGPLGMLESEFVTPVRDQVATLAVPPHATMPKVAGSRLGEFSGALGGASLAVQGWTPARKVG